MSKPKQIAITRTEEMLLDELAETSAFWSSVRAKYAEYGALTERQHELLSEEREKRSWTKSATKIGGVPVRNRYLTDKAQPRCAHRGKPYCRYEATHVVGSFGFCNEHTLEAREALKTWLDDKRAERARDRSVDAGTEDDDDAGE